MIQASYNPITGVSYVIVDQLPENNDQQNTQTQITDKINKARDTQAKQLRRTNTKSK